ncbi:hypothetical protein EON83_28865 [bacterium]|nr:MAG: hypothetical protein EON83_28865 [bacterium]
MPQSTNLWEGNHLSSAALAQYHQGILSPEALLEADAHLASCGECKVRLNQLSNRKEGADTTIVSLAQALAREELNSPLPHLAPYIADFPDFNTIADYVDGKLASGQKAAFEVALARFPALVKQVEDLRVLRDELNALSVAESAEEETFVVPPMIVRPPAEAKAPQVSWWRRLLWPMQTVGTVAASVLFFSVIWSQQGQISQNQRQIIEQENAMRQQRQQVAQSDGQLAKVQGENKNLRAAQKKTKLQAQASERLADEQQARVEGLKGQLEETTRQLRAAQNREAAVTPEPVATSVPSSRPTAVPSPALNEGFSDEFKRWVREVPDTELKQTAPIVRDEGAYNPKFQTLSPVATKVRELRPVLRWTPIKGATEYRIALTDETDGESVFEESVNSVPWRIPQKYELKTGHRYRWEITALAAGKVIGVAPQAPANKAVFEVLSIEKKQELEQILKEAKTERERILILRAAGLMGEVQDKLMRLQAERGKRH